MSEVKILDCTLRDGAYLVDKTFGDKTIHGLIKGLVAAQIDIIEIGFFQDDGQGEGKTVYKNGEDARKYIPSEKGDTLYSVLADYSRYSIDNLDENRGDSVDIIRACFFKKERHGVIEFCRKAINKGYRVCVQPVDILGYSDKELIDLIEEVNELKVYCFSIVDTFGSMYMDDLNHVFSIIDFNLKKDIRIGLHSHNNLQMSSALSQEFVKIANGRRDVVIDGTLSGMGRGAGNTPTELITQYVTSKLGYRYNMDALLDVIDGYMDNIRTKCEWGYTTPYFIAGCYSAHVNNIAYLKEKNSIRTRDIRLILNEIGAQERKRYDYDLLEKTYIECVNSDVSDEKGFSSLKEELESHNVLVIAPGRTASEVKKINEYSSRNNTVNIAINFIPEGIKADYLYFSNTTRYDYWINDPRFGSYKKIITSNVTKEESCVISFSRLIKCGWENIDNSTIMLLRLLDQIEVSKIGIVGMDGYNSHVEAEDNYVTKEMAVNHNLYNASDVNSEIREMLTDFIITRKGKNPIEIVVPTRFSEIDGITTIQ